MVGLIRKGNTLEVTATLRNKEGKAELAAAEKIETNKILDCEFESIPREERLKLKIANGIRIKKVKKVRLKKQVSLLVLY